MTAARASQHTLLAVAVAGLTVAGLVTAVERSAAGARPRAATPAATAASRPGVPAGDAGGSTPVPAPATSVPVLGPPVAAVALPLPGCPPPRPRPQPPGPPAWHPPVLVPEAALPEPQPAPAWVPDLSPLQGKGMWVWKYRQTEGGDPQAIVDRAVGAGLRQLWVRVGDSRDGFYGADFLAALAPAAHRRGLAVIGWGFPFLWDPVADARWTADVLAWRGPDGRALDGFSPDIEKASEGVVLTERRAEVYLGLVRQAAGRRLVAATVYRPSDVVWGTYPYPAIAPYVDAFAPMVYWNCTEPGAATAQALDRLSGLRPVHVIGQAYDGSEDGGRAAAPSAAETRRFLDVAHRQGALGASFWVWQSIDGEQWSAVAAFPWPPPARPHRPPRRAP